MEHWCKDHKQPFFKKGKMKGYAHPIVDQDGEPTGEWCNEPERETPTTDNGMSKGDWAEKDKVTRKSIERQTALKEAVETAKIIAMQDEKAEKPRVISTVTIIATAKAYEAYLEGKSASGDRLVEEAKKLGAEEIEP